MRVISGKFKGRKIEGYDIEGTRPTQDRVKESLFAMIQNELIGARVLDLFTGSGNLGIEALSNGADTVYFVDNNPKCIETVNRNLKNIDKDNLKILNLDYKAALKYFKNNNIKFDIIFLDPPYNLNCLDFCLEKIIECDILEENGIIICEYEFDNFKESYTNLKLHKDKKYGYKNIKMYKK